MLWFKMLPAGRLLPTPQIAVCTEKPAIPAAQFASLTSTHISFWVACTECRLRMGSWGQNVPPSVALSYRLLIPGREVIKRPGVSNISKPLRYPELVHETPL